MQDHEEVFDMAHPRSRIVALVIGCLLLLPALGLLAAGTALGAVAATQRDDAGYFDVTLDPVTTSTVAVTARDLQFAAEPGSPDWVLNWFDADVRLRVDGLDTDAATFVGIGRAADVDRYLAGTAHTRVVELTNGLAPVYRDQPGDTEIAAPTEQDFWVAEAVGTDTLQLDWEATAGRWSVVVMNADGAPDVAADVEVGLRVGFLVPLIVGLLVFGGLLTAIAVALIVIGASRGHGSRTEPAPSDPGQLPEGAGSGLLPPPLVAPSGDQETAGGPSPAPAVHPVQLEATLDPELSRWMWLVKWFLAIPHFVVLAFLWLAFVVLTVVAAVAILFTGRYPAGIFDFNVGVLRWSWRVSHYATTGGIGTDRYPPFTLDQLPDDRTRFDVAYPQRLSRPLVLVKWLLAIPHLVIVALLVGTSIRWLGTDGDRIAFDPTGGGGLLGLLVLVAGLMLLFTGRYPQALYDLIVGFNRWVFRVIAYVALMTDDYPPFRLDQGGSEPVPPPEPRIPSSPVADGSESERARDRQLQEVH
jgi:hypothetical protein